MQYCCTSKAAVQLRQQCFKYTSRSALDWNSSKNMKCLSLFITRSISKCWLLPATPSVLCCVVCSSVCGSVRQQEGLREHEKMNHPGIPAYYRYTGILPVNRGDGVARKKNTGKHSKPVNWRPVNRDIDCT